MKRLTAMILSFIMATSFTGSAFAASSEQTLFSDKAVSLYENEAVISQFGGWHESLYVIWEGSDDAENSRVYYKPSDSSDYIAIDQELIRPTANGCRADIVGISKGNYDVKIVLPDKKELVQTNIVVDGYDRSGYAHFNNTAGVGAYNDDGTPKDNADIIYLTNANKNDIEYEGQKGIVNIAANAYSYKNPLIIRVLGTVDTQARDPDGTKTNDIQKGIVAIGGLSDSIGSDGSYFNMCEINSASNVTIEGIGSDAVIEKWGFMFNCGHYIEVRNLHFTKYPEDACSFSGKSGDFGNNIWLHNCTFDVGENLYDVTKEQDKHEGDGSTDIKYDRNVTLSYNRFNNCHKTSLNGSGDDVKQYNITWHHNYFNNCGSRMPLVRQANVHTYNNYFYKTN